MILHSGANVNVQVQTNDIDKQYLNFLTLFCLYLTGRQMRQDNSPLGRGEFQLATSDLSSEKVQSRRQCADVFRTNGASCRVEGQPVAEARNFE